MKSKENFYTQNTSHWIGIVWKIWEYLKKPLQMSLVFYISTKALREQKNSISYFLSTIKTTFWKSGKVKSKYMGYIRQCKIG